MLQIFQFNKNFILKKIFSKTVDIKNNEWILNDVNNYKFKTEFSKKQQ